MKARSHVDSDLSGWTATKDRRWQRCPDCDIEGALHADGHVLCHRDYKFRLSAGCETCGGRGEVSAHDVLDSYSTGKA